MSDITKCSDKDCKLHKTCYRFNAKDSDIQQSYQKTFKEPGKDCEFYEKVLRDYPPADYVSI